MWSSPFACCILSFPVLVYGFGQINKNLKSLCTRSSWQNETAAQVNSKHRNIILQRGKLTAESTDLPFMQVLHSYRLSILGYYQCNRHPFYFKATQLPSPSTPPASPDWETRTQTPTAVVAHTSQKGIVCEFAPLIRVLTGYSNPNGSHQQKLSLYTVSPVIMHCVLLPTCCF